MRYLSCPTAIFRAPIDIVWSLLTRPEAWGAFYDVRIRAVEPTGTAVPGQVVSAESGPRWLHLKVQIRFVEVDPVLHKLKVDVHLPFGVTVQENLACVALGSNECRVNYHCDFGFPVGWRGALMYVLLRRALDTGPADSLRRLQGEAERVSAISSDESPVSG